MVLSGDHERATAEAQQLASASTNPVSYFNLGCVFAVAAEVVGNDESLAPDRRKLLAEQYADQALEQLHDAHQRGYFRTPKQIRRLTTEVDLRLLQDHPSFKKLVQLVQQL